MAKLICVFITIFTLCATNFATGKSVQPFIIGGAPAAFGDFPSVVSITSTIGPSHCLGNVINELHILTAASCVVDVNNAIINPFWLTITAGDLILDRPTWRRIIRNVTTIYPHPQFNRLSNANNLAVLRVGARFPFPHNSIEGATIATQLISTQCRLAGWGVTGTAVGSPINPMQQVINVPIHPVSQCQIVTPFQILDGMICGGNLLPDIDSPCFGAIGGGLYCGPENQLVGILAFNTACGAPNQPGVYIEVRHHIAWINQQFVRTVRFRPGTLIQQTV